MMLRIQAQTGYQISRMSSLVLCLCRISSKRQLLNFLFGRIPDNWVNFLLSRIPKTEYDIRIGVYGMQVNPRNFLGGFLLTFILFFSLPLFINFFTQIHLFPRWSFTTHPQPQPQYFSKYRALHSSVQISGPSLDNHEIDFSSVKFIDCFIM